MTIQKFSGQAFAFGLTWSDFASEKDAKQAIARSKGTHYVQTTTNEGGEVQHVLGIAEGKVPRKCIPAGLAIGAIYPNSIVAYSSGEGPESQWWVVNIIGGSPGADSDTWVSEEEAREQVRNGIARGHGEIIGNIPGAGRSLEDALQEFVARKEKGLLNKKRLAALTLQPKPSWVVTAIFILVLIAVVAGAFFAWRFYEAKVKAAQAQNRRLTDIALTKEQEQAQEAKRQASIKIFKDSVVAKRAEFEALSREGTNIWTQWDHMRRHLAPSINGYKPEVLECDRVMCSVQWIASGPRVTYDGQRNLPGLVQSPEPTMAPRSEFELKPTAVASGERISADYAGLLKLVQFAAPGASFEPAQPVVMAPPPDLGLKPEIVVMRGKFSYASPPGFPLVSTADAVRLLSGKGVFLTKVRFIAFSTGQGGVTLQGEYAAFQ